MAESQIGQQTEPQNIPVSPDLSQKEAQEIVTEASKARDEFMQWSQSELHRIDKVPPQTRNGVASYIKAFQESPSKNLLLASLSAVGLSNIGLTVAGKRMGLTNEDIAVLWYGTFGAPILEELIFRSKKIPQIVSVIGDKFGLHVRPDHARLTTNALFALAHVDQMLVNRLAPFQAFAVSETLQKVSNERGLAASTACHTLFNAVNLAALYCLYGPYRSILQGQRDQGLLRKAIQDDRQFNLMRTLFHVPLIGLQIGVGVAGIKELLDDKATHDLLERVRGAKDSNFRVDIDKTREVAKRLLAHPSTEGYKFQAGIELMYTTAMLSGSLSPTITPEIFARDQVRQAISEAWKDQNTLNSRLQKAFSYIDNQIVPPNKK